MADVKTLTKVARHLSQCFPYFFKHSSRTDLFMNKFCITSALAAALFIANSQSVQADTVLGLYLGADTWMPSSSGAMTTATSDSSQNFDEDTSSSYFVALEHPLPMIPNLMLRKTSLDLQGDAFDGNYYFNGDNTTYSNITLNQTDAIFYYELLDNGLTSLDLGINLRKADGEYNVFAASNNNLLETTTFSGYIPMLYAEGELGIITTGLSVYGDFNAISVGDHSMRDFQAGIAYRLIDSIAVDVSARLGYRRVKVELDNLDGISSNLDVKGITAGIRVHF
jgi:outer membrane protein